MSSSPEPLISLQHLISRLLPSSSDTDVPKRLSAAVYRASQKSFHSLHSPARAKDEIWHLLRSVSASPTPLQIDEVHRLVVSVHQYSIKRLDKLSLSAGDTRLSEWNDEAAAFFDEMILTAGAGSRVLDPREAEPSLTPALQQNTAASSSSQPLATRSRPGSSPKAAGFSPTWLRHRCAQLESARSGEINAHEMALSVLLLLSDGSLSDEHLQGDLFDAFNGDFDAVADVLKHRPAIRSNFDAIMADCAQAEEIQAHGTLSTSSASCIRGVSQRSSRNDRAQHTLSSQVVVRDARQDALRKEQNRETRRLVKAGLIPEEEEYEVDPVMSSQNFGGSAFEERQRAFPGMQMQGDSVIGAVDKVGLPKGSTREVGKGFEEIFVPSAVKPPVRESELVDVSSALKEHPELLRAMRGVKTLNRLQSVVFPMAFKSNENLLVCAPTGAGKTNVALLTIFREIVAVKTREKLNFKVVYVAPMKALAAEVTEKFSDRLGPLGLTVKEFTGDMSLSRAEALATNVLVTTPEKWDVVTRKTGSEVGNSVTLFIVDEIHLLHDERGAVLESIVARTLRFSETAQRSIRLVGLSATLPNYADVGLFMRVNPEKGLFHFDSSHRPVPLSQTFIGISEGANSNSHEARRRKEAKVHEMAWKKVKDSLQRGHQAMIFVHSRKGTSTAAREMLARATQDEVGSIFIGGSSKQSGRPNSFSHSDADGESAQDSILPTWAAKEITKSKTADIRELCARGIGIHNAGLPRPDRKLVEKLFADGVLRLLCCTATLAWGVNLPARTVVIMGTEVYNAEKGGFVQLGMLDVMQIFGRAGRPQFDTEGEGTIITDHEHLGKYLSLLTSSVPIESQLGASASRLADHLNAEIVSGTVSSVGDGVRWLSYTYLSVRMPQNPLVYGIDWAEVEADPGLHSRRATLIDQASKALDDARMCRYDPRTGILSPTDLGRVSSHFYVSHETVVLWNELLANISYGPAISQKDWERTYGTVIHAVSCATEFEQMRSREEETEELEHLVRHACPIRLRPEFGSETREGKVAILLQAHISRAMIRMSDLSYVVQSATRLLRALFEISLRRGLPSFSLAALELARASESRIWPFQHPLWQFTYLTRKERGLLITPETIAAIESSNEECDLAALRSRSREALSELIRAPKIVHTVEKVLKSIPTLEITDAKVAPLSRTVLSVRVSLLANFTWNDLLHGNLESWWLWIEDKEEDRIYHSQKILLTKRQVQALNHDHRDGVKEQEKQTLDFKFTVAVFDPPSSQYWVRIESDRWHTGGGSTATLSVASMHLPEEIHFKSDLTIVSPSNVKSSVNAKEAAWFGQNFCQFNSAQTSLLQAARHTDDNMLFSAPSGCGKMATAELAILRAFQKRPDDVVVFISLLEGVLEKIERSWKQFQAFGRGQMIVIDKMSDFLPTAESISQFSIILTTPQFWDKYMKSIDEKVALSHISLFVLNELHRLSDPSNVGIELVISRLRRLRHKRTSEMGVDRNTRFPRLFAMSGVLPNAIQVADWLGVSRKLGLFCYGNEARQVPVESHVISVAGDRYGSRMQSINRPLYSTIQRYSANKPVLIFVSSRRQTLLTARDLLRLASLDGKELMFLKREDNVDNDMLRHLRALSDPGLRQMVPKGIALYHENLSKAEREAVEALFKKGQVQIAIATFEMASRFSIRAHSVIMKGTEIFDPRTRKYEDVNQSDVIHMIGQAGRVRIDNTCFATIFVHEPKQTLFKKLLHEPLPVESGLLDAKFNEIILSGIASGNIALVGDAIEFLQNSFFFQRLCTNPGYYGLKKSAQRKMEKTGLSTKAFDAKQRREYCKNLVIESLQRLEELGCVMISNVGKSDTSGQALRITRVGQICFSREISPQSGRLLHEKLDKCVRFEDVMNVISGCDEAADLGKQYEEDGVWHKVLEKVVNHYVESGIYDNGEIAAKEMKINGWVESSEKRAKILCYALIIDTSTPMSDGSNRLNNIASIILKVTTAGVDIAIAFKDMEALKHWVRVKQCVSMGRPQTRDFWVLSGIGDSNMVKKARSDGWATIDDIFKDPQAFAMYVARVFEETERSAISRWVSLYPNLRLVAIRRGNDRKTITIDVSTEQNDKHGVGNVLPKSNGKFIMALWDAKSNCMVEGKRVTMDWKYNLLTGNFDIDSEADVLNVWVASETWVGVEAIFRE